MCCLYVSMSEQSASLSPSLIPFVLCVCVCACVRASMTVRVFVRVCMCSCAHAFICLCLCVKNKLVFYAREVCVRVRAYVRVFVCVNEK